MTMEAADAAPPSWEEEYYEVGGRSKFILLEEDYRSLSEQSKWKEVADVYYHDCFTDTEQVKFLTVPISNLEYFCWNHLDPSWLRDMVSDAVVYFKLHKTWQVHICPIPDCRCWFMEDDSLILHLMHNHDSAWPFLQRKPTEEQWCADALRGMVWKPIDVENTLNMLSTTSPGGQLDVETLEWPLSEDSPRSELLTEMQKGFEALLDSQQKNSFPVLSYGCMRALIAVASENILRHIDPRTVLPLSFIALLHCSLLSFRFMDEKSLSCFVKLVKELCDIVQHEVVPQSGELVGSRDSDVNWTEGEYFDAVSIPEGCDNFVLDGAKLKHSVGTKGIGSWLIKAPMFAKIDHVPARALEIMNLAKRKALSFSQHLRTVCLQSGINSLGVASCMKLWNMGCSAMSLPDTLPSELELDSEPNLATVNYVPSASCQSVTQPATRQRIASESELMQHQLELIKLTCELQFLESQARQIFVVDLRAYILPLLRSFLRMKLYVFLRMRYGSATEDDEEVDSDSLLPTCCTWLPNAWLIPWHKPCRDVCLRKPLVPRTLPDRDQMMEESQKEHPEEPVHVGREGPSVEGSDVTMPYLGSSKRSEDCSCAASSSGSILNISEHDRMAIDSGSVSAGIDNQILPVTRADAAVPRSRNSVATTITESEAEPEAVPQLDNEPETQQSEEDGWRFMYHLQFYSDKNTCDTYTPFESHDESEDSDLRSEFLNCRDAAWYLRDVTGGETKYKGLLETKNNGIFIHMTIADVMKHCLERSSSHAAQNMWRWRTYRCREYWRCFDCNERFSDEMSHMVHMNSIHQLELSCDHCALVPSLVWQGLSGLNENVKRTLSLDDSITVDDTYRTFLVEVDKFRVPCQSEEPEELQKHNLFRSLVHTIRNKLYHVHKLFETKRGSCSTSDVGWLDVVIVHHFTQFQMLKQKLYDLCVYDFKNEVLPPISCFLQNNDLMDGGLWSWAWKKFNELMGSVRCSYLPNSFSTELESPGKVIINIEQHNAGIGFGYVGLSWKFSGKVSSKKITEIEGSYTCTGRSDWNTSGFRIEEDDIIIENFERTPKMCWISSNIQVGFWEAVQQKLKEFEAEFRTRLLGREVKSASG